MLLPIFHSLFSGFHCFNLDALLCQDDRLTNNIDVIVDEVNLLQKAEVAMSLITEHQQCCHQGQYAVVRGHPKDACMSAKIEEWGLTLTLLQHASD